jgi:hypothetical protein
VDDSVHGSYTAGQRVHVVVAIGQIELDFGAASDTAEPDHAMTTLRERRFDALTDEALHAND